MKRAVSAALTLLLGAAGASLAQKPEALWYMTNSAGSIKSFLAHADQIAIVSPQVFALNAQGVLHGSVDPRVVEKAHEAHVKLVPLVMNPGFDQPSMHHILRTPAVRAKAIANIAALCRREHFDGIQFDIENVNVEDKDLLTSFMRETADSLHHSNCTCSAAVVPRLSEDPGPTAYHKWIFENWRGVYDYKRLAESLDFLSYMTYAQHTGGSTPGPVASYAWMEQSLQYSLSLGVPPDKISIGIPSYSDWWYPTYDDKLKKSGTTGRDISHSRAESILAQHKATAIWNETEKDSWAMWSDAGVYEYLWLEDARAFRAKMELVSKYHLRGYSVWVLGTEDPNVWR